jgi:hypothetical protein
MAQIGSVKLKIDTSGKQAVVDVTYDLTFGKADVDAKQQYEEECRLIGDDTGTGDPPEAGGDDTLGFLTPLFNKVTPKNTSKVSRHHRKKFAKPDLDEDRGTVPNPDEIRARVTLTPKGGDAKPVERESRMVKLRL